MYSPINYMKNYFLPDYISKNEKSSKNPSTKNKSNSLNSKKIILSRNENISNKNLILKTKTNNNNISYKQINSMNNQFSYESTSISHKKKKDDPFNQDSLYKYILSKIKENNANKGNHNHRRSNDFNDSKLYSTKLDFSMNQIKSINKQKKDEKNKFNKYKGLNKANKVNKNYYKKILNFPLSPENKNVKILKLNNLENHEVANSFNFINKEKDHYNHKRIMSSHNVFKDKITNNSDNINKINSFIYHNTNNINLNVNIINKGIILNSFNNTNNNENNSCDSLLGLNQTNNLTHRNINRRNKKIFNLSSYKNISINKENIYTPEEIHFKSVKYMQEIKVIDENYT